MINNPQAETISFHTHCTNSRAVEEVQLVELQGIAYQDVGIQSGQGKDGSSWKETPIGTMQLSITDPGLRSYFRAGHDYTLSFSAVKVLTESRKR